MRQIFRKASWIVLILLLVALFAAPQVQAGEYWKQKFVRFSATAGETLAAGNVVCIKAADSRAWKADADDSNLRPAVGVIGKGGTAGSTVEIVMMGILAGQTDASAGARLFLSTTAGAFTTTEPTNSQVIGYVLPGTSAEIAASKSSKYFVNVRPDASAGAGY